MKYLVRALKYFVQLAVLLAVFMEILILLKLSDANIDTMFVNGKDSIWQIALLLLAFSLIYPRFGYCTRSVRIPGSFAEIAPGVKRKMEARGYMLEKEEGEDLQFRLRSTFGRIARLGEDRITMTRTIDGFNVEGHSKDVIRVLNCLALEDEGQQQ